MEAQCQRRSVPVLPAAWRRPDAAPITKGGRRRPRRRAGNAGTASPRQGARERPPWKEDRKSRATGTARRRPHSAADVSGAKRTVFRTR